MGPSGPQCSTHSSLSGHPLSIDYAYVPQDPGGVNTENLQRTVVPANLFIIRGVGCVSRFSVAVKLYLGFALVVAIFLGGMIGCIPFLWHQAALPDPGSMVMGSRST